LFLRHFLHLLLVNLLLLASLKERSTHRELGCFLGVGDKDSLNRDYLVDEATKDVICLILGGHGITSRESFTLLLKVRLKSLLFYLPGTVTFAVMFPVAIINSYCQNIHILKQGGFSLFPDRDRILNLIRKTLIIVVA